MEDFVYYGELFNIYGSLLNESNKKYYKLYYEENLSMQEIADLENVSKSYVGNIIKKTSSILDDYESKLHIYQDRSSLDKALLESDISKIKNIIENILKF